MAFEQHSVFFNVDVEYETLCHLVEEIRQAKNLLTVFLHENYARGRADVVMTLFPTEWERFKPKMQELTEVANDRRDMLFKRFGVDGAMLGDSK
ncbi:hypothetical protein D3C78_1819470 [compost metagenome]